MPNTFELIASVTLTGSQATMSFTSIPSTFTDLVLKISPRSDRSANPWNGLGITFNGSSASYASKILEGGDSTVLSVNGRSDYISMNSTGLLFTSTFANNEIYISNYASSNNKAVSVDSVSEGNQSGGVYQDLTASLWANSAAINSITITSLSPGTNFVQYSTAYLYGVKNA